MFKIAIKNKKGTDLLRQILFQVILIGLILAMFFSSAASRVNGKMVKQQLIEKQTALMIDSAISGTDLIISKKNAKDVIKMEIKEGRVFVYVNNQKISRGYPYFTRYSADLEDKTSEGKYYIHIK